MRSILTVGLMALASCVLLCDTASAFGRRGGCGGHRPGLFHRFHGGCASGNCGQSAGQCFPSCPSACPAGNCPNGVCPVPARADAGRAAGDEVLAEVNALRAARGLRPFRHDPHLSAAALACAERRAERRLFGHTENDFVFLPAGSSCKATGCAAYPPSYGWLSCCMYDTEYSDAGAAYVTGPDGKRYMHLFCK